jgi:hypothetical protein
MAQLLSPEAVVQRQLDAYNSRDIDALGNADDAQMFEHPATLSPVVQRHCAKIRPRFREPVLNALEAHGHGSFVVDHNG